MSLVIIPPGLIEPSETTVSPPGSITVPMVSMVSSLDCISRPLIDIRILTTTRTLTTASCHFFTSSRAARASDPGRAPVPATSSSATARDRRALS